MKQVGVNVPLKATILCAPAVTADSRIETLANGIAANLKGSPDFLSLTAAASIGSLAKGTRPHIAFNPTNASASVKAALVTTRQNGPVSVTIPDHGNSLSDGGLYQTIKLRGAPYPLEQHERYTSLVRVPLRKLGFWNCSAI